MNSTFGLGINGGQLAGVLAGVGALHACAGLAMAQPGDFVDLGSITVPGTPASAQRPVEFPRPVFNFGLPGPGETLSVKWVRFVVKETVEADRYLDIDSRIYNIGGNVGDLFFALYDAQGNLVATDDVDGSFPVGFSAGLSFGSGSPRIPAQNPRSLGQDGTLAAGVYWLAIAANATGQVTAGPTGWQVSTPDSYQLGFLTGPDVYLVDFSIVIGNTTPLPRPVNDDCATPLAITEDAGQQLAWVGSNFGATNDATGLCDASNPPIGFEPKDIWFTYTPSQSGIVQIIAGGGAGGAATPVLTVYAGECGSQVIACSGGEFFTTEFVTRVTLPVTQGSPVLLRLHVFAGQVGPLDLSVRLLEAPVTLVIPPDAVPESEANCGDSGNNGCNVSPPAYDPIVFGRPVTGTLFSENQYTTAGIVQRDVDWYIFTLDRRSLVTLTYAAQYPLEASIVQPEFSPGGCFGFPVLVVEDSDPFNVGVERSGSVELEPGEYRVPIGHRYSDGILCGLGYERYWLRVDATPIGTGAGCNAADVTGIGGPPAIPDGLLTGDDFNAFISVFAAGEALADITGIGGPPAIPDGLITGDDFNAFIAAFAAGCP